MPKINEILLKLEVFKYDVSLDLIMGYYYIQLSDNKSKLYMIVLPWGGIFLQTSTNGNCKFIGHFPTEN